MSEKFSHVVLEWYDMHGRKDLPWQHPRSAYRVWVSEIMLQQTQVKTVIPYFMRFMAQFPTVNALANATLDEVLAHWSGLGYYSRARNMHKTAIILQHDFQGQFPSDLESLIKLPGIGPSTAAAIASLAFNKATAILDGNVKRVLSRYFLVSGLSKDAETQRILWQHANECMPNRRCADYTQAIMDLGATCCTTKNPNCTACPLRETCRAHKENDVSNYPQKNPKKTLPIQHQQFLLLHQEDLIYLEKRPSPGLWGGLWCLPHIAMHLCPQTYLSDTYQLPTNSMKELMTMKHSFSHFHLYIRAVSLAVSSLSPLPGEWFSAQQLPTLGLSKPVSKILNCFLTT